MISAACSGTPDTLRRDVMPANPAKRDTAVVKRTGDPLADNATYTRGAPLGQR